MRILLRHRGLTLAVRFYIVKRMRIICAWCKRELPAATVKDAFVYDDRGVSHGLCQPCYDGLFAKPDPPDVVFQRDAALSLHTAHHLTPKHLIVAALVALCVGIAFLIGVR